MIDMLDLLGVIAYYSLILGIFSLICYDPLSSVDWD